MNIRSFQTKQILFLVSIYIHLSPMENTILQINQFLKKHSWCDFEIINLEGYQLKGQLVITGKTGFSDFDIQITFEEVFFMQCLYEWKTDTTKEAFSIPDIEEQKEINLKYGIETGYYLFRIHAEDIEAPMYISAKNCKFELLN